MEIDFGFVVLTIVMLLVCGGGLWIASLPISYPKKRKTGRRLWPGRMAKLTRWQRGRNKI